jgi:chromosomal replication initiator protein
MNPRNTFESFVVGTNNQFAHAASLAIADAPGGTYNPLFIYGGVGLGKTHLMQAIGQRIASREKSAKVIYRSGEGFTSEFIDAIRSRKLVEFRKRYRQTDLLLIDDIQLLTGKECTEEFLQTFNVLFDGQKQIVLGSDRPPAEINNLDQRLVARFEWGLTAELQPPDLMTRMTILRNNAERFSIPLCDTIIEVLAQRINTNIRRLIGALMRVASFSLLSGHELTLETMEHLLQDIVHDEASPT